MKIEIIVKPRSGIQEITEIDKNKYLVKLKSSPENNKANLELLSILKKTFKKDFKIVIGKKLKKKVLISED